MWRTEKAFDPKFISSVRFSLNTSQINVDDVKYSQSVRSSISRDIFEAISENSEIKMRRSIQVLPLLLLLYHSKPHETIIDRIVAYTSKFYEKFDILQS